MNFLFGFLIILIQLIITIGHYIVYRVIVGYSILPVKMHSTLFYALILLSFSFTVGNLLVRFYPSKISSAIYFWSSIWMGTFHFLFIASVFVSIISIFKYPTRHYQFFVTAIILSAIATSIYGYLNSKIIRTTRYDVPLDGLPDAWDGKKAVMFADSHFGVILNKKEAENVANLINNENPDVVFMSGDFYDGPKIDFKEIAKIFEPITPKYGKFFVTGNHEEYAGREETIKGIHVGSFVVTDESPITTVDGVQVIGIPYFQFETDEQVKSFLSTLDISTSTPSIVLKHVPNHLTSLADAGVGLVLSGHTHQGQVWPFMYLTKKVYKGFDYGLNTLGKTQVITTSGTGSWGPPQRVGTFPEIVVITFKKK